MNFDLTIYFTGLHQLLSYPPENGKFPGLYIEYIIFNSSNSCCGACGKVYYGLEALAEGCGQNCG